jgi:hypothetical protein
LAHRAGGALVLAQESGSHALTVFRLRVLPKLECGHSAVNDDLECDDATSEPVVVFGRRVVVERCESPRLVLGDLLAQQPRRDFWTCRRHKQRPTVYVHGDVVQRGHGWLLGTPSRGDVRKRAVSNGQHLSGEGERRELWVASIEMRPQPNSPLFVAAEKRNCPRCEQLSVFIYAEERDESDLAECRKHPVLVIDPETLAHMHG